MSQETFNLDRENKVDNLIDSLGKKWEIVVNRQNGLCHARPNPDRSDAVIPKIMQGQWTKPSLLRTQIEKYVNESWNKAEDAIVVAERKKQALKEATKK